MFANSIFLLDEINSEREFYRKRNLPYPKEVPLDNAKVKEEDVKEKGAESDYHRFDEQVNFWLSLETFELMSNEYILLSFPFRSTSVWNALQAIT